MDDKALEEKAFEFCEKSGCLHGASLTTLLREVADEAVEAHMDGCGRTTYNLAKSAERAEAEVARLLAQLSKADRQIRQLGADSLSSLRERDEARAEVERLREIAKAYSSMTWEHDMIAAEVCPRVGESLLAAVKRVVYAALRGDHCGGEPAVVRGVEKAVANLPNVTAVVQAEREK